MKAHTNTLKTSHDDEESCIHDDEKQSDNAHSRKSKESEMENCNE